MVIVKRQVSRRMEHKSCFVRHARDISRILKIAINIALRRIREIAKGIVQPTIVMNQKELEVDELRTYVARKGNEYRVAYALNSVTKGVTGFSRYAEQEPLSRCTLSGSAVDLVFPEMLLYGRLE
jgi:hypothetical protein